MKNGSSLLFFVIFNVFFCTAQKATFQFYTVADGLGTNRVWDITQDSKGFLWIGTEHLNRFDGYQFLNRENHSASIFRKNIAHSQMATIEDQLLALVDLNLMVFNPDNGEEQIIDLAPFLSTEGSFSPGFIHRVKNGVGIISIIDAANDRVCLLRYHQEQVTFFGEFNHVAFNEFGGLAICGDAKGNLFYLDKEGGLVNVDAEGKKIGTIPLSLEEARRLKSSGDSEVLLLADRELFVLEEASSAFKPHPVNAHLASHRIHIYDFEQTAAGDLWICGDDRQLLFYDKAKGQLHSYHEQLKQHIPNHLALGGVFIDNTGVVWITTVMGLLKVTPQQLWFDSYFTKNQEDCPGRCSFRGFTEDKNGKIYASYYTNIFTIDPNTRAASAPLLSYKHQPSDLLYESNTLLLNNGEVFDLNNHVKSNPYKAQVTSLDAGVFTQNHEDRIWWALKSSFYELDKQETSPAWSKLFDVSNRSFGGNITDIKYNERQQKVWIATEHALGYYDLNSKQLQFVNDSIFEANSTLRYLHIDDQNIIWIGADGYFGRYDLATGSMKRYSTEDGLPNNTVIGILPEGDSCLWLSTHLGLARFNKATEEFINFFEADGLAHNEFNRRSLYKAKNGQFFFGGIGGVTAFYPEEVMENYKKATQSGKLSLVAFSKTDAKLDTTFIDFFKDEKSEVDIFYKNKTFSFEVALTNYLDQEKVLYSYQLEGYDNQWSKPGQNNKISFNSLPGGKYKLRVKALNNRGQWQAKELEINVVVHAPWWKTWWAFALYFGVLSGLAYGVFYVLKKRWELKNKLALEQQEAQRLKELDHFKSQLYTNLTHEFRTPLTVILGMAKQIVDAPQKDIEQAAGLIERNGQNLLRLVNQLLDLSKLEDKSFRLNLKRGDIIAYLRYVTESFQTYANSRNLSLQFFTTISELVMDFDMDQVQQIMTNLISNAAKFTRSGGAITILLEREADKPLRNPDSAGSLLIKVKDTGIGIAKEHLPHIFDRFYQVANTTTRTGEGTGIGLAHTSELVKLMKGDIAVTSELGNGTIFTVSLPIQKSTCRVPYVDVQTPGNSSQALYTTPPALEDKTSLLQSSSLANLPQLLIIEDNPDVVFYLKSCLADQYQLDVAYNGKIGIEKALENLPDLIISDVMMPEKDGYEVCDTLKTDVRTSHIPIILLTAKADGESKIRGLRQGADAYLAKPFNKEELLIRLEKLVELRKRLQERYARGNLEQLTSDGNTTKEPSLEDDFVQEVIELVRNNFSDEDFNLPQLCQKIGMSRSQLFRKMKALMNISPSEFIRHYRLEEAKRLLETGEWNVSEVADKVGYKHLPHFSKNFQEAFGYPPSATNK